MVPPTTREMSNEECENTNELEVEDDLSVARHRARISDFEKRIKEATSRKNAIMDAMSDAEMS